MKFEIRHSQDGQQYYVVQKQNNGEILNTSEMLNSHQSAVKNIKSVYKGFNSDRVIPIFDLPKKIVYHINELGITQLNQRNIPNSYK